MAIFYFTVALDLLLLGLLGTTNRIFNYLSFFYIYRKDFTFFGGNSESVTPVPIPNTEVKPLSADGTAREAWWESRSPPILFFVVKPFPSKGRVFFAFGCSLPFFPALFCSPLNHFEFFKKTDTLYVRIPAKAASRTEVMAATVPL